MKEKFILGKTSASAADEYAGTNEYTISTSNLPVNSYSISVSGNTGKNGTHEHGGLVLHNTTEGLDSYGYTLASANANRGTLLTAGQVAGYGVWSTPVGLNLWRPAQLSVSANKNNYGDYKVSPSHSEHNHSLSASGSFKLNSNTQTTINKVSAHYKMAYIQRIY